jgi:sugar-specific transcriptional regulator TrmB
LLTDDEAIWTLMQLGLCSSQAKLYFTLIKLGEAKVNTLAKVSNIDRGETYRVMSKLVDYGFVEKIIDSPFRYKPILLAEAVSILLKQKQQKDSEIEKKAQELLTASPALNFEAILKGEESKIFLVSSGRLVNMMTERFIDIKKCYDTITVLSEFDRSINDHYKSYKRLLSRGVPIRCVIENLNNKRYLSKTVDKLKQYDDFKIKFVNVKIPACLGIYDDQEVRIGISEGESCHLSSYWSRSSVFVGLAKNCFEKLWSTSE